MKISNIIITALASIAMANTITQADLSDITELVKRDGSSIGCDNDTMGVGCGTGVCDEAVHWWGVTINGQNFNHLFAGLCGSEVHDGATINGKYIEFCYTNNGCLDVQYDGKQCCGVNAVGQCNLSAQFAMAYYQVLKRGLEARLKVCCRTWLGSCKCIY